MISQSTIEEVKARASLLDVVGDSVQLKRSGSGYAGLCPFHSERTPSFHVRDNEQFFHCFGCGKSGNVFTYLMETQGLSFPEAVELLAQRYGIEIKREGGRRRDADSHSKKNDLYALNALAAQFYRDALLKKDKAVVEYVRERKLTKGSVDSFTIGYAPLGNQFTQLVKDRKIPEDVAVSSGLVRRNQRGELYDALRGRLVFPIWVDLKRIAGFGGRMIPALHERDGDTVPKYINSPESPIYQKSKILYGLPQAVASIKELGEVYVVEGYLDVIGLAQVGIKNVVATCGTALTDEHVRRLSRMTKRILVMFDADSAGKAAAGKSFLTFLNAPVDVWALFPAEGEDPDSIAKMYGERTGQYLAELDRRPLIDCYIDLLLRNYDATNVSELGSGALGSLCKEVAQAIAQVQDVIARDSLTKRASIKLKVPSEKLAEVSKTTQNNKINVTSSVVEDDQELEECEIKDLPKLDQEILNIVMAKKENFLERILKASVLSQHLQPVTLRFIQELSEVLLTESTVADSAKKDLIKDILKSYGSTWTEHWRRAHDMGKDRDIDFNRQFEDCILRAQKQEYERLLARLRSEASLSGDDAEKSLLLQQVIELEKKQRGMVSS